MLCACSGEQFHFEDAPQSPESLATRDFSVSCPSSRTAGSKLDNGQVDDIESTLKETLSLNYEEARALLGRLEYQRGNFDAALQVFQGIDICGLKPLMTKAIIERTRPRKSRHKGEVLLLNVMSLHSVTLLLEAILLKSKSLEELGRDKEAAIECTIVLDIVEDACPDGMPQAIADDFKLREMCHTALELIPKLWKQAGSLEEAITSYRRALIKPWNMDPQRLAGIQKDLASVLLFGGSESIAPSQFQHLSGPFTPSSNLEEAILLLTIIIAKVVSNEIVWDPEIMEHLAFALSTSGQYEVFANHIEKIMPGCYYRGERWYLLALCYSATGNDEVALNALKKAFGRSEKKYRRYYLPSLIFAAKLCSQNPQHSGEGVNFAQRALVWAENKHKHLMGVIYRLLGTCYAYCSTASLSDSQRLSLQKRSLEALECAADSKNDDPETNYMLAWVNAMQRNLKVALENAIKYCDWVAGSSMRGWKLLALIISAEQNYKEAESIVDLALDETATTDQLELLRLKAVLQNFQDQPKSSVDTYKILLAIIQSYKEQHIGTWNSQVGREKTIENDTWLDLADIYIQLGLLSDSDISLRKAKLIGYFSPRSWHTSGKLLEARSLHNDALVALSISLSIEPDYVPSMVSIASVLLKLGRTSLLPIARSFLMNALRLEPMNHEAWLNLGLVMKEEGVLLQAADCFQAAYELELSSPVQGIT